MLRGRQCQYKQLHQDSATPLINMPAVTKSVSF